MVDKFHPPEKNCAFVIPKEAGLYSCPANAWIWLIHSFLQRIRSITSTKKLEEEYSKALQEELRSFFNSDKIDVFWAPAKEKPTTGEIHHASSPHEHDNECSWSFSGAFNSVLADLNNTFHSQFALRKLSDALADQGGSPAFVYLVKVSGATIFLTFLNQDNLQSELSGKEKDLTFSFSRKNVPEPKEFFLSLKKEYDSPLSNGRDKELQETVENYVKGWDDFASIEPSTSLLEKQEFLEAAKHFTLMSLYMAANDKGGASYFLAPSIYARHDSSMVIYWPTEIPDRNLHYLLQMVLKLNAFPLIMAQGFREKILAQEHNLGNLNPVEHLSQAIEILDSKDLGPEAFDQGLLWVKESHKKLRLMTVALDISFGTKLNEDALSKMKTFKAIFDFLLDTRENVVGLKRKAVQPDVVYSPGAKDVSVGEREVADLFNCIFNLWHNAGKRYVASPERFWVVLHKSESGLDISFVNEGVMKSEAKSYLLGQGPYPKLVEEKGKGGLEVVKDSLNELSAELLGVYIAGGRTNVKVRFPA